MNETAIIPTLYSARQCSEFLKVSERTIFTLTQRGELRAGNRLKLLAVRLVVGVAFERRLASRCEACSTAAGGEEKSHSGPKSRTEPPGGMHGFHRDSRQDQEGVCLYDSQFHRVVVQSAAEMRNVWEEVPTDHSFRGTPCVRRI